MTMTDAADMNDIDVREVINAMAFSRVGFYNSEMILRAYREAGSATVLMDNRKDIRAVIPDAQPRFVEMMASSDEVIRRAEAEYEWDMANGVTPLVFNDAHYPERLRHCPDAPLVLFYKGEGQLNQRRVISIVGTRHCTTYGQDVIRRFVSELRTMCPQTLIVSGLAYGVDINAHQSALNNGFETVAVLAHGLDCIYPSRHKPVADRMLSQGGLLSEYFTMTNADKMNFVRRNRIVAGMCDATILVESAAHGGGLITADLAFGYNRDVYAFPGNVGQQYSEGCNNIIRDRKADLISSAYDFVNMVGWADDSRLADARKAGIERQLFPELSAEELRVVDILAKDGDLPTDIMTVRTGYPVGQLAALLFSLEMKGMVKSLAGGAYHLLS